MDCLTNYIGIRGECTTAKMYIDDLPGINIQNAADIIEGMIMRPQQLVENAFRLATDQVFNDWINLVSSHFDFQAVLSDGNYNYAGNKSFYPSTGNIIIEVYKSIDYTNFVNTSIYSFGIYSDREIEKSFYIHNDYGDIVDTINVMLNQGYNDIPVDIQSSGRVVFIVFDGSDFEIGKNDLTYSHICNPCQLFGCNDCNYVQVKDEDGKTLTGVGFNLKVKCVADKCALIKYFFDNLRVPLLYKTGINFLIEAKATSRVNSYTRNSVEKIDELLNIWQGGVDTVTGIKTNSAYWQSMKAASTSTVSTLKNMRLPIFTYNASEICNMLP